MKILIVGMPDSVHCARWINQLAGAAEVHFFPAYDRPLHPDMKQLQFHPFPRTNQYYKRIFRRLTGRYINPRELAVRQLAAVIKKTKPDIVHSLEMQTAGHLTRDALAELNGTRPPWIVTTWGSDLILFSRLSAQREVTQSIARSCDYLWCECQREHRLATNLGFRGRFLPLMPATGGIDLAAIRSLRRQIAPSDRRLILVKGYQGTMGRSLVALEAIRRCADSLRGHRIGVYSGSHLDSVMVATELLKLDTGLDIEILPTKSHWQMLELFAQARAYIGLSISDGVSNSAIEAMALGAFPIQSKTSCIGDWMEEEGGRLVPSDDPAVVAEALVEALTNDALVNQAAETNFQTVARHFEYQALKSKAIEAYRSVLSNSQSETDDSSEQAQSAQRSKR